MRYTVALPARLVGGVTAFTPNMTRLAASGAQMYKHAVTGQPGTLGIPAPTRDTQISPDEGDKAQMGTARSSDAPTAGSWSTTTACVPAQDPRGLPALLAFTPQFLGQKQVAQPRVMPNWGANV